MTSNEIIIAPQFTFVAIREQIGVYRIDFEAAANDPETAIDALEQNIAAEERRRVAEAEARNPPQSLDASLTPLRV